MPITVGAIRKLRADAKKARENSKTRSLYKDAVSKMRKNPSMSALEKVFSLVDRAAKRGIIHRNKAARLKARLSKKIKNTGKKK